MTTDELINKINPDRGYERWVTVGNALYHAGETFETWDRWSSGSVKYSKAYAEQRWLGFAHERPVSLEEVKQFATEEDSVRRAPWIRQLWAADTEEKLARVTAGIRADYLLEDGDRAILRRELQKAWRTNTGQVIIHNKAKQLIVSPKRARAVEVIEKDQELLGKCFGHLGVSPEVIAFPHLIVAMTKVTGRPVETAEARKFMSRTGYHRYGSVLWNGASVLMFTAFRVVYRKENHQELRLILASYHKLTQR